MNSEISREIGVVQINRGLGKSTKISIIIPVYNAEKNVKRAVESVLQQKECGEVILVKDRSPDNALEICRCLAKRHEEVKFFSMKTEKITVPVKAEILE